jgi:hypothetical protein
VNVSIWISLNSPPSSKGQPTELEVATTPCGRAQTWAAAHRNAIYRLTQLAN